MLRTIARNVMLGLALPLAQACSGASASGRTGDRAVAAESAAAERPEARHPGIAAGLELELRTRNALTSRTNHPGDPITATAVTAAVSADGDTVIPAGAEFRGTVREIAAAPTPRARAHLALAFTEVKIGESVRPIQVRVTAMATHLQGRGVTGGTVAKVGAGALVGGLAGRLIGRSGTGTVVRGGGRGGRGRVCPRDPRSGHRAPGGQRGARRHHRAVRPWGGRQVSRPHRVAGLRGHGGSALRPRSPRTL